MFPTIEFKADLHCHSCFSDGTDTPEQLIDLAIKGGLSGLSITDHDTVAVYESAFDLARKANISLLNGVEFSAAYRSEPVHILAYGFHLKSSAIAELCEKHKKRRLLRNQNIVRKLNALGIKISLDELEVQGSFGRPHIAQLLLEKGVVITIQEAFEKYLAEGKLAYDPGEPISVEQTIDTIHAAKGKAILAHPHLLKRSTTIRALLTMPFDGLEGYYARLPLDQEEKWLDIGRKKNWIITGGSDYHGHIKPRSALGSSWVGKETFDLLYNHFLSVN